MHLLNVGHSDSDDDGKSSLFKVTLHDFNFIGGETKAFDVCGGTCVGVGTHKVGYVEVNVTGGEGNVSG